HAKAVVASTSPTNHPSFMSCCSQANALTLLGKFPVFSICIVSELKRFSTPLWTTYAMRGWVARLENETHRSRSGWAALAPTRQPLEPTQRLQHTRWYAI